MRKTMTQKEHEKRQFHAEVRKFKEWCTKHKVAYYTFDQAPSDSVCAISMDEYALGVSRQLQDEDHESLFLQEDYYEEWEGENII